MKQVKFFDSGKWAEHKPYMAQFEVKKGVVMNIGEDLSPEIAAIAVNAKRAEYVKDDSAEKEAAEKEAAEKEAAEKEKSDDDAEYEKMLAEEKEKQADVKRGRGRPAKNK